MLLHVSVPVVSLNSPLLIRNLTLSAVTVDPLASKPLLKQWVPGLKITVDPREKLRLPWLPGDTIRCPAESVDMEPFVDPHEKFGTGILISGGYSI